MKKTVAFLLAIACAASCAGARGRHRHRHHRTSVMNAIAVPPVADANAPEGAPYYAPPPGPPPPVAPAPAKEFNVLDYGAAGDGESDDTDAFRLAWADACQSSGDALLLAPKNYVFLIHSLFFLGPCLGSLTFELHGTIAAPADISCWPESNHKNWLVFYRVGNFTLTGTGLVDGQGEQWWNLPCKPHHKSSANASTAPCDSPVMMRFFVSANITVRGIRFKNSPQFHLRFDSCRGVAVDGIAITSPANSPNTDGIHVENTADVEIRAAAIANGDDCISIGAGSANVAVENVTCGPGGHGISIGSLGRGSTRACVANVTVRNAAIRDSDNGVRIKTWPGGSGSVTGVAFVDVAVDNVRNPIIIDQYYCLTKDCANDTSSAVMLAGITYAGIRGTYDVRSPPVHLACSDAVPCTNITLVDIALLPASGGAGGDPFCWNAYGSAVAATVPPVRCLLDGLPRMITDIDADRCYR